MLIKNFLRNITRLSLILILILCIPHTSCKKQSTTPVIDDLTRPVIWMDQHSIYFSAIEQGPNPSSQTLKIKNSGEQTLEYALSSDADWVHFSPDSGKSTDQPNDHTISVNKAGMAAQDQEYTAKIMVTSSQAYNNPQEITVSLKIEKELPPRIGINTKQLSFKATEGGKNPDSQTIKIRNTGEGTLSYSITSDMPWMSILPASGTSKTGEKSHTVNVDIGGMNKGTYLGIISVTDPKAVNDPQEIDVTLTISEKPEPKPVPTNNEVGIRINPSSGGTGTIVTITVFIKGNTAPIEAFGLELHYNTSIFQYLDTKSGTLTGSWGFLGGNASAGTIVVGGARLQANPIPVGSQGSLAVVRLRVIPSGAGLTTITMDTLRDDIEFMKIKPASVTFTN